MGNLICGHVLCMMDKVARIIDWLTYDLGTFSWVHIEHQHLGALRLGGAYRSLERVIYIVDASKLLRYHLWQVIHLHKFKVGSVITQSYGVYSIWDFFPS